MSPIWVLPSKLRYSTFGNDITCGGSPGKSNCNETLLSKVKTELQGKGIGDDHENLAKEIVSSHYYACSWGQGTSSSEDEWCQWFYYWLGNQIKDNLNGHELKDLMFTIYGNLANGGFTCVCRNLYSGISKELFEKAKILFDYKYDYDTLQNDQNSQTYSSISKCSEIYQTARSAYQIISQNCDNGEWKDNPYCTEFMEGQRATELNPRPLPARSCRPAGDDFGLGNTVVRAVGRGLASIALPAIAYLFYKYKPQLFSFGGNRNRSFWHGRNGLNRNGRNRGRSTLRSELNTTYSDHDYDGISTIGGSDSMSDYGSDYMSDSISDSMSESMSDSMSESMTDASNYSLPYTTSSYR